MTIPSGLREIRANVNEIKSSICPVKRKIETWRNYLLWVEDGDQEEVVLPESLKNLIEKCQQEHDEILELHKEGQTDEEIAIKLDDMLPSTIRKIIEGELY